MDKQETIQANWNLTGLRIHHTFLRAEDGSELEQKAFDLLNRYENGERSLKLYNAINELDRVARGAK